MAERNLICFISESFIGLGERISKSAHEPVSSRILQQGLEHEANLFRFACLPNGEYDPKEIFCEPSRWYKPFEDEPISLLWKL